MNCSPRIHHLAFTLLLVCCLADANERVVAARPNVLFIAVDDMRDWTGFMEGYSGTVLTPHMDALAARGTAFLNAHCAAPVCCPSRAAVMSGLLPSSTGIRNNQQWWKPHRPGLVTLPMAFKQNGYRVVGAGKVYHHTVGNNPPGQWDAYHRNRFTDNAWAYRRPRQRQLYPFTPIAEVPAGFPFSGLRLYSDEVDWGVLAKTEKQYDDSLAVDYSIRFLREKHERPFFLACGIFRPHLPWYVPQRYLDLYPVESVQLPRVPADDLADIPPPGQTLAARKRDNLQLIQSRGKWKEAVRHYLASISFADAQVGRLLDALYETSAAENTVVVLWSDHGWHLGEKGHWHKRTLWEAATRVPLIVVSPAVGQPRQRCVESVSLIDIYPTLVDFCSLNSNMNFDGSSLAPQLADPKTKRHRPALTQTADGHCSVRDIHWRYIRYVDGSEELYDHRVDPHEWNNVAADPDRVDVKRRLGNAIPKDWAANAPSKKAYEFDPIKYSWRVVATGATIEGGTSMID
jgi:arylsulfatase A-like enzyme